nr:Xaa-Pro peptidase family protein [Gammaproteobacteria bacterium]
QWCNATDPIQYLRQIKSETEIDKIRYTAQTVSAAYGALPELLSRGLTEQQVFKLFKHTCLQLGVDDTPYVVGATGAGGYGDIISPPSERQLQSGDVLILDTGCVWDGYFCDFDRNFAIGKSDSAVEQAYRVTWDATEAGLAAAQVGATCSDLFNAMQNVMEPFAVKHDGDVGRLGHGLGTQLTETPSHTHFDHTALQPGMVLTLEPGYCFAEGKVMVHEENIVIREGGPELLSVRAAEELPVIDC